MGACALHTILSGIFLAGCASSDPALLTPKESHGALQARSLVYWMPTGSVEIISRGIEYPEGGRPIARIDLVLDNRFEKKGWDLRFAEQRLESPGETRKAPIKVTLGLGQPVESDLRVLPGSKTRVSLTYEISAFDASVLEAPDGHGPQPALLFHWKLETPQGPVRELAVFDRPGVPAAKAAQCPSKDCGYRDGLGSYPLGWYQDLG
ncbi:MAG TPA: hypothetical protein VM598_12615 [Bdellovibrionota bacterium]|nr:hypothetical protein [Bdellovibrionota bacterium]